MRVEYGEASVDGAGPAEWQQASAFQGLRLAGLERGGGGQRAEREIGGLDGGGWFG